LRQCCRQNRSVETKWAFRQFLKASLPLHLEAVTHSLEAVDQISHNINTSGQTVRLNRFKGPGEGLEIHLSARCDPFLVQQPPVADLASCISRMIHTFFRIPTADVIWHRTGYKMMERMWWGAGSDGIALVVTFTQNSNLSPRTSGTVNIAVVI
jgi:hypothetical protein